MRALTPLYSFGATQARWEGCQTCGRCSTALTAGSPGGWATRPSHPPRKLAYSQGKLNIQGGQRQHRQVQHANAPIAAWYGSPQLRRFAGGNTREPGRPDTRAIFGAGHPHPGGTAATGSAQGRCRPFTRRRRGPMGHGSQRPLAREAGNSGNRKCRPAPEDTQIQSETGQTAHPSSREHMEIRSGG